MDFEHKLTLPAETKAKGKKIVPKQQREPVGKTTSKFNPQKTAFMHYYGIRASQGHFSRSKDALMRQPLNVVDAPREGTTSMARKGHSIHDGDCSFALPEAERHPLLEALWAIDENSDDYQLSIACYMLTQGI